MDKDEIIEKISEHVTTRGGLPHDWYVGVSQNPERCLPVNHKVDLEKEKVPPIFISRYVSRLIPRERTC